MLKKVQEEAIFFSKLSYSEVADKKADVKDINFDSPDFIQSAIVPSTLTSKSNLYNQGQLVYWKKNSCYAKIISFNEEKNQYLLNVRADSKSAQQNNLSEQIAEKADVTQRVTVCIRQTIRKDNSAQIQHKKHFRYLDINEPILDQIGDLAQSYLHNGILISEKTTPEELNLHSQDILFAMGKGSGRIEPLQWIRTKNIQHDCRFMMRQEYNDALRFMARGDTTIYGFLFTKCNKDHTLIVSWSIDDEPFSEDFEWTITGDDGLQEDNFRRFDFQDFGIKPLKLLEKQRITFRARCPTMNAQFEYVRNAYPEDYHSIEGQENMFHTLNSRENRNSTYEHHGMFPGILYFGGTVNEDIGRYCDPDDDYYEEE